ncbi:hypothetical protein D3C72_2091660 [compost metagenome]
MRVPCRQYCTGLDGQTVGHHQGRAVRHLVTLALAANVVMDHHFAGTSDHDQLALAVGHVTHLAVEAHGTV